ncbi:MAG: type II toxin-antitoxin system VapC family toxin [Deltaproteobacteria bacterium]|nr:type II toxin-antitoxin system VapC family toxin [Deltaproteobacteria bacterium]
MNVVDSSGWLEYFADGPNADKFAPAIQNTRELIVPTLSIYEVFRRVLQQRGATAALRAVALMRQGREVVLDTMIALSAAKLSVELKLPMADSIILATARSYRATLWTQDADFKGTDGVKYFGKR